MRLIKSHIGIFILLFTSFPLWSQVDTTATDFQQFFYANGVLSSEGLLIDGKPEGLWKTYYESGTLKTEGERAE